MDRSECAATDRSPAPLPAPVKTLAQRAKRGRAHLYGNEGPLAVRLCPHWPAGLAGLTKAGRGKRNAQPFGRSEERRPQFRECLHVLAFDAIERTRRNRQTRGQGNVDDALGLSRATGASIALWRRGGGTSAGSL